MPARQSFEQSQLASQIGVGYGEAQVLKDRAALIEQTRANKAKEAAKAAEAAKKAEKEKQAALNIEFPNDLAPAMQTALAREATKLYDELLPYYGTDGFDRKRQELISEFSGKIAQAKEYTRQFKSGVNTYAKDRGTKNYNPDTDDDVNLVMNSNIGDASWDDVSGWMDKANTDLSTSYTSKGYAGLAKEIMPMVEFGADKKTIMFPGKDGNTYTTTTEEFSEDDAKNLIRQTISTSDTPNDWLQSGLAEMSDADKKTYGEDINGIADYFADRFASDFTRDNIKTTYKEPKKGRKGEGYSDLGSFSSDERDMNVMSPYAEGGFFGGDEAEARAVPVPIKGSFQPKRLTRVTLPKGATLSKLKPFGEGATWDKEEEKLEVGVQELQLEGINVVPVFNEGEKGEVTGVDLSNRLVDKDLINNPEFKGRWSWQPVAIFLGATEEDDAYAPLSEVESEIESGFGDDWADISSDIYARVEELNKEQQNVLEGTQAELEEAAETLGLPYEEYKKSLEDKGYTIKITG
jgi:hypothetical protein